jgi:hypothetical protein
VEAVKGCDYHPYAANLSVRCQAPCGQIRRSTVWDQRSVLRGIGISPPHIVPM